MSLRTELPNGELVETMKLPQLGYLTVRSKGEEVLSVIHNPSNVTASHWHKIYVSVLDRVQKGQLPA